MFILIGKEFLQSHICGLNIRSEQSVPTSCKKRRVYISNPYLVRMGVLSLRHSPERLKRRTIFLFYQTFSVGDAGYQLLSLQL